MPAITLGLVEIEERLQVLRRRLNTVTALHAAFLSLSAVFLVVAALVAVGLRGDVTAFRTVTWSGGGLAIGVLVASVIAARRRWVDLPATAELADQRGELTDRLTTLVDLRRRPRPSRLAPVLVAQTLALGERWRPQRIAPRRVPRSLFLALLSLLALTASPLVAPAPPPAAAPPHPSQHPSQSPGATQDVAVPAGASPIGSRNPAGDAASGVTPDQASQAAASQALTDAAQQRASTAESAADAGMARLPDRVRNALRSALHAEQMNQGRALGKAATGQSTEPAPSAVDDRSGAPLDGRSGRRADESGKPAPAPERGAVPGAPPHPGDAHAGGQPQAAPHATGDDSQRGAGPNAGTGSHPEDLLGAATAASEPGHGGASTFKLTITSFLHAVDEPNKQPGRTDKRRAGLGATADTATAGPALNEQQLRDDALRKAEIPPEYEDIVRRVYSSREPPDDAH